MVISGDYRVERRGVIMLTFWPAIGERKYDWDKRQVIFYLFSSFILHKNQLYLPELYVSLLSCILHKFALSATEVGTLIAWDSNDSCEFFHDPSMLSSNAGQVRKSFSIKAHSGGTSYFFNLSKCSFIMNYDFCIFAPSNLRQNAVVEPILLSVLIVLFADVVNNVLKTNDRFTVPVTPAEFAVMQTAFTIWHHL
ncbi:hypothetical protein ACS0TY_000878 [Phlomoides rotata]